jgi:hypothetical protein
MRPAPSITAMIVALAGMIAWGLHLALIYAIATLACLQPQSLAPAFDFRIASVAMTVMLLLGLVAYLVRRIRTAPRLHSKSENASRHFLDTVAVAFGLLAVVVILWATLSVFIITDCRTQ